MICVVIGRTRHKMMQIEIQEAAKQGAQLIELRLDFLAKAPDFKRLLQNRPCPMIATVRRQQDGGRWLASEEERRTLLRQAIVAGFDWVDIEMDAAKDIRRYKDTKRIISYHNFRETPENLEDIYKQICELDADIVKIAVTAQRPSDNLRVLKLLKRKTRPTVAHCMGDLGFPSRILSAKFGAAYSYAAFNKERGIAPGMPSFDEMKNLYHYDDINADTKVFGVIGDPVGHSLSPAIHNAAFRKTGFNGVYLPFRVPRGALPNFLKNFAQLPVTGFSVTIPHKEAAYEEAVNRDESAELIKAANTLILTEGGYSASNTDYTAARDSILNNLPQHGGKPIELNKMAALVLGAGGVARAIVHVLHQFGMQISVTNRTLPRAQEVAKLVQAKAIPWEGRHNVRCDFLVNCTPVGMHPHVDDTPIHHSFLKPGLIVFDTVYTPENTLLVKEARARGCHVITGVDMFVRQATEQFRKFTGIDAYDMLRKEVKRALLPIHIREEDETK